MRYFLTFFGTVNFIVALHSFTLAQCPPDEELHITSTLYSQENGLLSTVLINIAKDTTGYRYFKGVDDNWIRYDGINFSMQDRFNNTFFSEFGYGDIFNPKYKQQFFDQRNHKLETISGGSKYRWVIINDSLVRTNLRNNSVLSVRIPDSLDAHSLLSPHGEKCWIASPGRIFLFDMHSKQFRSFGLAKHDPDQNPRIFINTNDVTFLILENAAYEWDGSVFHKICSYRDINTESIEIIMGRYLFIGGDDGRIEEIDLERKSMRTIEINHYFNHANLSAFTIITLSNYKDYLLICTANAGLFIFNRCSDRMQQFVYDKRDIHDAAVNASMWMAVDQDEIVWIQTEGGLIKLEIDQQHIRSYMPSSLMRGGICQDCNNVRGIYPLDKDNILVGTIGGVYQFSLTTRQFSWFIKSGAGSRSSQQMPVSSIAGDGKGTIFIGSWLNEGVGIYDPRHKLIGNVLTSSSHPGMVYDNINTLFYDSEDALWVGTNKGFFRVTGPDQLNKWNDPASLKVDSQLPLVDDIKFTIKEAVFAITSDRHDNIWMGTRNGLYIYSASKKSIRHYVHESENHTSLSDSEVRSIYISPKDEVWIGTKNGGLNHFDQQSEKFVAYTTQDGLPNNSIYTIREDQSGYLWLGTNGGLCRIKPLDLAIRNYTPRDGIQHFEFNTNAVAITDDGMFCFGGRSGLNLFHPDSMNKTSSASPVTITKFMIFDKEFPVTTESIHLPHDQNSFTFDFATLNYYRSNDNQYAYQLEGADKHWVQSGNRTFTNYANLQPGTYTFKVRAANYTGTWHPEHAFMNLIIHPAWYNTWWFRTMMMLGIVAGFYILYRYRLYQVTKFYSLRNRIASDLHDDIGSTLSSISLSSTIIQQKLNGQHAEITRLLQQVSKNTDDMMEALSDIVWAIHTRNDRFDNVLNRMRAFAIEVLEPAGINLQFEINQDLYDIHLNMQQRKNVYLIFKEAINNISKYAGCRNVIIRMERQGSKRWMMEISDDGNGFETSFVNSNEMNLSGNGIRNMRKRAEEVNGTFNVVSSPGKGVKVQVSFIL